MSRIEGRLFIGAAVLLAAGAVLAAYAGTANPGGSALDGIRDVWNTGWTRDWAFSLAVRITLGVSVAALVLTVLERLTPRAEVGAEVSAAIRVRAREMAPIDAGTDEAVESRRRSSRPPPPSIIEIGGREQVGLSNVAEQELDKLLLTPHGLIVVASRQSDLAAHIGTVVANRRGLVTVHTIASREAATHALGRARDRLVVAPIVAPDAAAALGALTEFAPTPAEAATHLVGALAVVALPALCPGCREPRRSDAAIAARFEALGLELGSKPLFEAKGCGKCGGRGTDGERNVAELVIVDPPIRRAIASGRGASSIAMIARAAGHASLREEILHRVARAELGVEEALSVAEGLR